MTSLLIRPRPWGLAALLCAASAACSTDTPTRSAAPGAGAPADAGPGAAADGGTINASDRRPPDATTPKPDANSDTLDAGPPSDAGAPRDAGPPVDAGAADAGAADAGPPSDAGAPPDAGTGGSARFRRHTVDGMLAGPAYVAIADVDGRGGPELVVASFGSLGIGGVPSGQVRVYARGADLSQWTLASTPLPESSGVKFPNQPTVVDVDGDLDLDLIVPTGFLVCTAIPLGQPCGGLAWLEQTGAGWQRHDLIPNGAELFYHGLELVDFDGDGLRDLVTTGERAPALGQSIGRAETIWLKGTTGPDRFETTPRVIGEGLGSFPRVRDVDGDGDLDVAGAEFFTGGSFAWFERTAEPSASAPAGVFTRHVIDADSGPSIMLSFVADLQGDGVTRAVGTNHSNTQKRRPDPWESAVYVLDPPADPRQPWTKRTISTGIVSDRGSAFAPLGAPGIFGSGDLDGDGDVDLAVAGDGDPRIFWLEQTAPGVFVTHVLAEMMRQGGGMAVGDLDGDGDAEVVVTGYEANAVYVFERL